MIIGPDDSERRAGSDPSDGTVPPGGRPGPAGPGGSDRRPESRRAGPGAGPPIPNTNVPGHRRGASGELEAFPENGRALLSIIPVTVGKKFQFRKFSDRQSDRTAGRPITVGPRHRRGPGPSLQPLVPRRGP
eukprot:762440-Hanusia_phi.AAC.1